MATKADEIIRIRNEGAAAYDGWIQQFGYEAARQMLINRVGTKCNVAVRPEEHSKSVELIKDAVTNTYLTAVFTTLHDAFGFGAKRLKQFKAAFDELICISFVTDRTGKRYVTLKDCAEEMNALADLGIDVQTVEDTEAYAVESQDIKVCSVTSVIKFLKDKGETKAADMIWRDVFGLANESEKVRTKEQRAIAKKRRRADRRYRDPCMNMFDPDVNKGYLAIFAKVLAEHGTGEDDIMEMCGDVNGWLNELLDNGKAVSDDLELKLEETYGFTFE